MRNRGWLILAALALVLGCSAEPVRMTPVEFRPLPAPARTPFDLTLEYTSDLADPFYVTSGPGESYARYSISAQFRALLERQVAALTTPGSSRHAILAVRMTELTTRFRQLGAAPGPPASVLPRYASNNQVPLVVPASYLADFDRGGANSDIPEEIHRGATLTATLELSGDGITPMQQTVTADHDDVMFNWDYDQLRAYSYTRVLDRTLRAATAEITAIVQATLK